MSIEVRPAGGRYVTEAEGRTTFHSFSFGSFYDPRNLGFAAMTALNDEHLPAGTGYDEHRHSDVEIVTWVLDGALRHTDDSGATRVLRPGDVQRTSAGTGILHSEVTEPGVRTRFLQTWLRPDEPGVVPSYAVASAQPGGELTEVVGPDNLGLGVVGARLYLAEAEPGRLVLPEARLLHVFVVSGAVALGDHQLCRDDAARMTDQGGRVAQITAPSTVAVWAFS